MFILEHMNKVWSCLLLCHYNLVDVEYDVGVILLCTKYVIIRYFFTLSLSSLQIIFYIKLSFNVHPIWISTNLDFLTVSWILQLTVESYNRINLANIVAVEFKVRNIIVAIPTP